MATALSDSFSGSDLDVSDGDQHSDGTLNSNHGSETSRSIVTVESKSTEYSDVQGYHQDPILVEVGSMIYSNFRVKISKQSTGKTVKYFYEPLVVLEPQSASSRLNKASGQAQVQFTVELWNLQVEEQVLKFLTEDLGIEGVKVHQVQVTPYYEILLRLLLEGDNESSTGLKYHLPKTNVKSYSQLNQKIQFCLECDTPELANELAEEMKKDPGQFTQHLAVEFRFRFPLTKTRRLSRQKYKTTILSFNTDSQFVESSRHQEQETENTVSIQDAVLKIEDLQKRLNEFGDLYKQLFLQVSLLKDSMEGSGFRFTESLQEHTGQLDQLFQNKRICDDRIRELEGQMTDFRSKLQVISDANKLVVPLFKACRAIELDQGRVVTYDQEQELITNYGNHGRFNKTTGKFNVQTPGIYLFQFNGITKLASVGGPTDGQKEVSNTQVQLRVNGNLRARCEVSHAKSNCSPVIITSIQKLKEKDEVDIFVKKGKLYDSDNYFGTQFSGILLSY